MKKINVLMLAPEFAPSAAVGAKRSIRLFSEMLNAGWEPYVLTVQKGCCERIDLTTLEQINDTYRIYRIGCKSIWNHSTIHHPRYSLKYYLFNRLLRAIAKATDIFVPTDQWFPWSYVAYSKGLDLIREKHIDVMWATLPRRSGAHLAYRLNQKTRVPYILDFRDVRHVPEGARIDRKIKRILDVENQVLSHAAGLTYVAPAQIETLHNLYPQTEKLPSELIYNWFDRQRYADLSAKPFDRPTIVYGGSLYGGTRDVKALFQALSQAHQSQEPNLGRLQFVLFGLNAEFIYLQKLIQQYHLDHVVDLRPAVSEDDFIAYCKGATILLLSVGRNQGHLIHSETIPAKLFTYFGCDRPILAIGPDDFIAGRIVEQVNRGIAVDDQDANGIFLALQHLLQGRGKDGTLDLTIDAVKAFESHNVADQYLRFIKKVLLVN